MTISTNIEPIAGFYHGMVFVSNLTAAEKQAVGFLGEPTVDVGGNFSGNETRPPSATLIPLSFTFTSANRRIVTDFPVKQIFDSTKSVNADLQALFYVQTVTTRIQTAMNNILSPDTINIRNSSKWTSRPYGGTQAIGAGASFVVVGGLALSFVPVGCIVTVMMPSGGGSIGATPDLTTLNSSGVTVDLDATTPNANYILSYLFF